MISNTPFLTTLADHKQPISWTDFLELPTAQQNRYYCARIRRSLTRLARYTQSPLHKLYDRIQEGSRLRASNIIILPRMVGLTVSIYNGKSYQKLKLLPSMVGKYIGCFRLTRKKPVHTKVTKKKAPTGKKG